MAKRRSYRPVFTPEYQEFLKLLVAARANAGMNQRELASRIKRPQSYVGKSETGERRLDLIEFLRIAKALGVNPAEFIKKLNSLLRAR